MPSNKTSRRRKKTFLFEFVEERTESPALDLAYHLTPWDEPAMACATAAISHIELKAEAAAERLSLVPRLVRRPRSEVGQLPFAPASIARKRVPGGTGVPLHRVELSAMDPRPCPLLRRRGDRRSRRRPLGRDRNLRPGRRELVGPDDSMWIQWSARRSATAAMPYGRRTPFAIPGNRCSNACSTAGSPPSWLSSGRLTRAGSGPWWPWLRSCPGKGFGRRIWRSVLAIASS